MQFNVSAKQSTQLKKKMGGKPKQTFLQRRHKMSNKHMNKNVQHHSLLEKCKSKLQWGIILTLVRIAIIKKIYKQLMLERMCKKGTLLNWCEYKLIQPQWRAMWRFLKILGLKQLYDTAVLLLGMYSEKTIIQKDTYTPVFIAALFIIARTWRQPRCPSTDKQIKIWYIYTLEYYSAIKRNEWDLVALRWMNLEPVIQSEVRKRKTNIVY